MSDARPRSDCFAALGVVVVLKVLWIRISRATRPLGAGVGTATVVLALLPAFAAHHGVTLANQN